VGRDTGMIERFRNVLVLGAHPDDEVACAGTLARLHEHGARIHVLTFSRCSDTEAADVLRHEWEAAIWPLRPAFGGEMLDIPNRRFPEYRQSILNALDTFTYDGVEHDLVLVPARSDSHQDHATVTNEAIRVFKRTTMLGYEHAQNTVGTAIWNALVPLEPEHVERKLAHVRAYASQADRPYMKEAYIRGVLMLHGMQAGVDAAEAFEVIRWVA
jgi:LmbE family N-acetylglucosaminyl deacetylase